MAEAQMTATMSESQGLGGTKSSLGVTKSLGGGELGGTKELQTTVKESMSLIDRFYNGGNAARPEALNILVVVLDSVVRRMREQKDTRQRKVNDIDDEVLYGSNLSVNLDNAKLAPSSNNNLNLIQPLPSISKKVHSPNLNHRQEIKGNESKFEPRVLPFDDQCHNFRYGI